MKIVLVGSGNVATAIALAFKAIEVEVAQIWSKQYQHALVLAKEVNAAAIKDLAEVDHTADFCIIAVKDDAILEIATQLKDFKGIVVHTSGAVNMEVFTSQMEEYGVLYPLQTFSKGRSIDFSIVPLCIEGNTSKTLKSISELANKLSSAVVEINSEKRKILHLAAVFACNFTNHLYALAAELLSANNLTFDLLKPLITETAAKVQGSALPQDVQTGPAIRNDRQTLQKQEALLAKEPQLLNLYQILSESIKKTQK
ncbi:MAG: DUF2520 domain-containing protein [Bacteroidota bacterium]